MGWITYITWIKWDLVFSKPSRARAVDFILWSRRQSVIITLYLFHHMWWWRCNTRSRERDANDVSMVHDEVLAWFKIGNFWVSIDSIESDVVWARLLSSYVNGSHLAVYLAQSQIVVLWSHGVQSQIPKSRHSLTRVVILCRLKRDKPNFMR